MLCRHSSTLADALPLWLCYLVDASPPFRCACSPLAPFATVYPLCAGSALRVAFGWVARLECPPPPCFCCSSVVFVAMVACVFSCTFLQCFCVFSPLCSCVSQPLFGYIKFCVCNCLMKYVPRHGYETIRSNNVL